MEQIYKKVPTKIDRRLPPPPPPHPPKWPPRWTVKNCGKSYTVVLEQTGGIRQGWKPGVIWKVEGTDPLPPSLTHMLRLPYSP